MFLNTLNEEQKNSFLSLAIKAAEINNVVTTEEKTLLKTYAAEMGVPARYETDEELADILNRLCAGSSPRDLRIVLFEVLGLMYADNEYDEVEKAFISQIASAFQISQDMVEKMGNQVNSYAVLLEDICSTIECG